MRSARPGARFSTDGRRVGRGVAIARSPTGRGHTREATRAGMIQLMHRLNHLRWEAPVNETVEARWLLLIHQIPPQPNYLRVKVRRRLQQLGAVAIKQTVYALPKGEQAREDLEWVRAEI